MRLCHTQKLALIALILCCAFLGCNQQESVDAGSGEAKKGNPAAIPSSTSQQELRVVELDEISFAEPELKKTTQAFHDHADSIANDDWFVDRYRRSAARTQYTAKWQTSEVHSSSYLKSVLPHRSMSIELEGPRATAGGEAIDSLQVIGRWIPTEGWAAAINYNVEPMGNGHFAAVSLVQKDSSRVSFDDTSSNTTIRLMGPSAKARVRENGDKTYHYQARLSYGDRRQEGATQYQTKFLGLFKSPENLRDSLLGDIAELRQIARDQIPRLENVGLTESTNVSSSNPPRERPVTQSPPSETIKKQLLQQVMSKLDATERAVNENYQEIHAAITKAMPLDALNMLPSE